MPTRLLFILCLLALAPLPGRAQFYPFAGLKVPSQYTDVLDSSTRPTANVETLASEQTEIRFRTALKSLPKAGGTFSPAGYGGTQVELRESGVTLLKGKAPDRLPNGQVGLTGYGKGEVSGFGSGTLLRLATPEGRLLALTGFWIDSARPGPAMKADRVLTIFWQYAGSRMHQAGLLIGLGWQLANGFLLDDLEASGVVVRNGAYGLCFKTHGPKNSRYLTYWLDSGTFTNSRSPVPTKKRPAKNLRPEEVEAVQVLER